jgi:hypothetical protein
MSSPLIPSLARMPKAVAVRTRGFDPFVKGVAVGSLATIIGVLIGLYVLMLN